MRLQHHLYLIISERRCGKPQHPVEQFRVFIIELKMRKAITHEHKLFIALSLQFSLHKHSLIRKLSELLRFSQEYIWAISKTYILFYLLSHNFFHKFEDFTLAHF